MNVPQPQTPRDFFHHPRDWRGFKYVYPVLSRRSRGLSIGINLNPDGACNFDCIYCQVDRSGIPRVRQVDPAVVGEELDALLVAAGSGRLYEEPEFADTPEHLRRLNDIAFSGDGEPTTCPVFTDCVRLVADLMRRHASGFESRGMDQVKLILITDACYLQKPNVVAALEIMDHSNGEIWAKLDAGTDEYYQRVNRPNFPLSHVIDSILHAARSRPVTIQSLLMRIDGQAPPESEIIALADRLNEMGQAGARIDRVQVYTIARQPAESNVTALTPSEINAISETLRRRTALTVETFSD